MSELVLLARYASIAAIAFYPRCRGKLVPGTIPIMTWSGLRVGIPIALAISLPETPERSALLIATYMMVAFSILVQGTTLKYVVGRPRHG